MSTPQPPQHGDPGAGDSGPAGSGTADRAARDEPAGPGGRRAQGGGRGLLDFAVLGGRLRVATGVIGALALAACITDALLNGLTFALMARWAAAFLGALVVVAGVIVAVHAAAGARTARARGERLSSDGPGLVPPRRRGR